MITVTVGIAAYNAENNIRTLLDAIAKQKSIKIVKVIVHSDASQDRTDLYVREYNDKRIILLSAKKRGGFAHAVATLFQSSQSEVLVILNDDIKISDEEFLAKLVRPFHEQYIGLTTANIQPLKPRTFIEAALVSRLKASEELSKYVKNGNNIFSCDGKAMALSKQLIKEIKLPKDYSQWGNVDAFLYFSCITNNFLYRYVTNAIVYYRTPTNFKDYARWISRNNANRELLEKQFGDTVNSEYRKPTLPFLYTTLKEVLKNPLGSMFIFGAEFYLVSKTQEYRRHFNEKWDTVKSTKTLN